MCYKVHIVEYGILQQDPVQLNSPRQKVLSHWQAVGLVLQNRGKMKEVDAVTLLAKIFLTQQVKSTRKLLVMQISHKFPNSLHFSGSVLILIWLFCCPWNIALTSYFFSNFTTFHFSGALIFSIGFLLSFTIFHIFNTILPPLSFHDDYVYDAFNPCVLTTTW